MEDIKKMIKQSAEDIIKDVDGISEGSKEYTNLLEQLVYIQTVNYNQEHPDAELELPPIPAPLRVNTAVRTVAAKVKEEREFETLEELEGVPTGLLH